MKFWTLPATCNVCGGYGRTSFRNNHALWTGGFFYHTDPRVCARIIQAREAKIREAANQLVKATDA